MNGGKLRVAYARCDAYGDREKLRGALRKVLAPQFEAFGSVAGKKIMLKPNFLVWKGKNEIASVNPAVVVETAALFLEAGAAKVDVLETPAVQTARAVVKAAGIASELERMNVRVGGFEKFAAPDASSALRFHNIELASEFRDYDAVVDIAKAKTHGMMTLTLCVKNLFGLIRGSERLGWHLAVGRDFPLFADMLLDLYITVAPRFNILDGIVCMEGNGPGSGTPAHRGFLAGSTDSLALDASAAHLLGVDDLLLLRRAEARGLLPEYENGGDVPAVRPLKLPDPPGLMIEWGVFLPPFLKTFLRDIFISKPVLDRKKCIGCGLCVKMCPPRSLKLKNGNPVFDLKNCIRCYCCQEHCPKSAIRPRKTIHMRIAGRIEKLIEAFFGK